MTHIAEYSQTEAALTELREKFSIVPDATTKEGYAACKEASKELRGYRMSLESMRKELKAPALERSRAIDSEAKRITLELTALEDPMSQAYKLIDAEKKRIKEEAEQRELDTIDAIRSLAKDSYGKSSLEVAANIETAANVSLENTPSKFLDLANNAKKETLAELEQIMRDTIAREQEAEKQAIESERIAKERAELETLRAEQEERDRAERFRLEEAQRKIDEENQKIENERIRVKLESEAKERAECDLADKQKKAAEKKQAEAEEIARVASLAPDREKLESFATSNLSQLMTDIPDVTSDEAKALTGRIMKNIKTLQTKIIQESKSM